MSNNPTISNNYVSTNPDYKVTTRELANQSQVQQVQLDIGTGDTASPVTSSNPLPVTISGSSSGVSSVTETTYSVTTSSSTALASNANRLGGYLLNLSDETIWVSFGGTASNTKIPIFQYGSLPFSCGGVNYTGAINVRHYGTGTKSIFIQWCE